MANTKVPFSEPELSVEELSKALFKASQQLTKQNEQLKANKKQMSDLYANLSHDLRSPLASLKGQLEYLLTFDDIPHHELIEILHRMNRKISSIELMANEMLIMTTLDSSPKESTLFEELSMVDFLQELFLTYITDPRFNKRILKNTIPSNFVSFALINKPLFIRAFDNLLLNALKYSNEGDSITLSATIKNKKLIISITDTGIGISEFDLPHIFERTFRVANARTPDPLIGCGLGLSIVASIINTHGGEITCISQLHKGSTFSISIPLLDLS